MLGAGLLQNDGYRIIRISSLQHFSSDPLDTRTYIVFGACKLYGMSSPGQSGPLGLNPLILLRSMRLNKANIGELAKSVV